MKATSAFLAVALAAVGCSNARTPIPPQHKNPPAAYTIHRLMRQGQFTEAKQLSQELLQRTPDHEFALSQFGQAHLALGDRNAARQVFLELQHYHPQNRDARHFLHVISRDADARRTTGEVMERSPAIDLAEKRPAVETATETENGITLRLLDDRLDAPRASSAQRADAHEPQSHTETPRSPRKPIASAAKILQQQLRYARLQQQEAQIRRQLAGGDMIQLDHYDNPSNPMPPQPRFRADLGQGRLMEPPNLFAPKSTTGGSLANLNWDTLDYPRRALVGQFVPASPIRSLPNWKVLGVRGCQPLAEVQISVRPSMECRDGKDNNADMLVDREDPNCWELPGDPTTYRPFLSELVGITGNPDAAHIPVGGAVPPSDN